MDQKKTLDLVCTQPCLVDGQPVKRAQKFDNEPMDAARLKLSSNRFALADSDEAAAAKKKATEEAKAAKTAATTPPAS